MSVSPPEPIPAALPARFTALVAAVLLLCLFNGGISPAPVACFAAFAAVLLAAPGRPFPLRDPSVLSLLALLAWFALAALAAASPRAALHQSLILLSGALVFLHAAALRRGQAIPALRRLAGILALFLALALAQYALAGTADGHYAKFERKLVFTLGHYNHMGTLLLLALPLPFILAGRAPVALAAALPLFALVLLTGSRGALGAALLALPLLMMARFRGTGAARPRRVLPALLAAAVALAAAFAGATALNPDLRAKFTTGFFALRAPDGRGRDDIWDAAARIARDHPALGVGPGNYPVVVPAYARAHILDAHNLPLGIAAETGVPGLLLALLFAASLARARAGEPRHITLPLRIGLFAALVQNLSASTLALSGALSALFFLLAGLSVAASRDAPDLPAPSRSARRFAALCAALLAAPLSAVALRLLLAEGNAHHALAAERAGRVADAHDLMTRALRFDPENAVLRVNRLVLAARCGAPLDAAAERAAIRRGLPFCPLAHPERGDLDRSGYAALAAARRHLESAPPEPAAALPHIVEALTSNPMNAWSVLLTDPARTGDGVLAGALERAIDPDAVSPRAAHPHILADWFLIHERHASAAELYRRSPVTPAFARPGTTDFPPDEPTVARLRRLFDLVAADLERNPTPRGARFVESLRGYAAGGEIPPEPADEPVEPDDLLRAALLDLLRGEDGRAAERLAAARAELARRWPAPYHFAYLTRLAADPRTLEPPVRPLSPAFFTDDFEYRILRVPPLPFLAAAIRAGGTTDGSLLARFRAACLAAAIRPAP